MNLSFRTRFTDLCYGYNAFWADLIPVLDLPDHELVVPREVGMLWGDGFEIETLINCRFAAAGRRHRRGAQRRARPHLRHQQPARRLRRLPGAAHAADGVRQVTCRILRQRLEQDLRSGIVGSMGIRVGMVSTRAQPEIGGVEAHVAEVAGRLVAHGYELELLTTDRNGDLPKVERHADGYTVRRFRSYPQEPRLLHQPRPVPRGAARRGRPGPRPGCAHRRAAGGDARRLAPAPPLPADLPHRWPLERPPREDPQHPVADPRAAAAPGATG